VNLPPRTWLVNALLMPVASTVSESFRVASLGRGHRTGQEGKTGSRGRGAHAVVPQSSASVGLGLSASSRAIGPLRPARRGLRSTCLARRGT
jgi:hypothetical protein